MELLEPGVAAAELPAESVTSRSPGWAESWEERRQALWRMHRLVLMTQHRLGMRYHEQLELLGLMAKIELSLISFFRDTLPDPGMEWDGDRHLREINRRVSRLLWVERQQEREFDGLRGIFNWLLGRRRLSGKELVACMVEEADRMMGVLPEDGVGLARSLGYDEAAGIVAGVSRAPEDDGDGE